MATHKQKDRRFAMDDNDIKCEDHDSVGFYEMRPPAEVILEETGSGGGGGGGHSSPPGRRVDDDET
jgi:hypothetical protein